MFLLLNMSILPLIDSFISTLNCCTTSAISCLNYCGNVAKSLVVTMSAHDSAGATTAAAAAAAVLCLASATMSNAANALRQSCHKGNTCAGV